MGKIISYIDKFLIFTTILLFVVLLAIMTAQIMLRYIFGTPIRGIIIYSNLIFTWLSYLGCVFVSRDNEHLKVEYFINKFPEKLQNILQFIYKICPIVVFIFLFKSILNFFEFQAGIDVAGVGFSVLYFTYAFVVGFLLMAIYSLVKSDSLIESIFTKDNKKESKKM